MLISLQPERKYLKDNLQKPRLDFVRENPFSYEIFD